VYELYNLTAEEVKIVDGETEANATTPWRFIGIVCQRLRIGNQSVLNDPSREEKMKIAIEQKPGQIGRIRAAIITILMAGFLLSGCAKVYMTFDIQENATANM
jgi:hypothetical protein